MESTTSWLKRMNYEKPMNKFYDEDSDSDIECTFVTNGSKEVVNKQCLEEYVEIVVDVCEEDCKKEEAMEVDEEQKEVVASHEDSKMVTMEVNDEVAVDGWFPEEDPYIAAQARWEGFTNRIELERVLEDADRRLSRRRFALEPMLVDPFAEFLYNGPPLLKPHVRVQADEKEITIRCRTPAHPDTLMTFVGRLVDSPRRAKDSLKVQCLLCRSVDGDAAPKWTVTIKPGTAVFLDDPELRHVCCLHGRSELVPLSSDEEEDDDEEEEDKENDKNEKDDEYSIEL